MGKVTCHDGTPFRNYVCPECGFVMHIHKSQLPPNYQEKQLWTRCKKCDAPLLLPLPKKWTGEQD